MTWMLMAGTSKRASLLLARTLCTTARTFPRVPCTTRSYRPHMIAYANLHAGWAAKLDPKAANRRCRGKGPQMVALERCSTISLPQRCLVTEEPRVQASSRTFKIIDSPQSWKVSYLTWHDRFSSMLYIGCCRLVSWMILVPQRCKPWPPSQAVPHMGYTAKHVNFYFNYMPVEVLRVGGSEARKEAAFAFLVGL